MPVIWTVHLYQLVLATRLGGSGREAHVVPVSSAYCSAMTGIEQKHGQEMFLKLVGWLSILPRADSITYWEIAYDTADRNSEVDMHTRASISRIAAIIKASGINDDANVDSEHGILGCSSDVGDSCRHFQGVYSNLSNQSDSSTVLIDGGTGRTIFSERLECKQIHDFTPIVLSLDITT